ncbi:NHL domain-containing protein [Zea mays]|uniref:NHL domain-containing protein n=1 Tax=Zea mays TaxID=4577 RepID=A0A1D6Q9P9_MAIZE|nr:NHL domain-containing protein [Zea mays]
MATKGGNARGVPVGALLVAALLLSSLVPTSASSYPARVVSGFLSNAASAVVKRLWSLKSTTKTAASGGKSMVKYEGGYTVETVFDGSKLGIEPYSVEVTQSGELLVMDSMNSNIYRMALPLSRYSRPKLVAGSPEGFPGHVDGKLREARMNHPKGFTVDDKGNIYVADAMNMAIRKISDTGVTTIAGGKSGRGGHVDGPSDEAKFSTDFEVRYIGSSCSLLVIDRGNQAIREIQLHFDDCVYQYEAGFPLGVALLLAAAFFGYMLALLQRRVLGMYSNGDEDESPVKAKLSSIPPPYQKPLKSSLRPPLIPNDDEPVKQEEEGLFTSIGKLVGVARSSVAEIVGATFSRKKRVNVHHHQLGRPTSWPVQESYAIPRDETPPPLDTRAPTPRKSYAFMSKEPEKIHHIRHGRPQSHGWTGEAAAQQQQQQQVHHQQYHNRQYSAGPQTFYEPSCDAAKEIVFGAVQEGDTGRRRPVEIKPVNHGDVAPFELNGLRFRSSYGMG